MDKDEDKYDDRIILLIIPNSNKHLESLPDTSLSFQIFDWKQFARHSFFLFDSVHTHASRVNQRLAYHKQNDGRYRNSPTIKFCTDEFPVHRCSSIKF